MEHHDLLHNMRHSASHLLAMAVLELRPNAKLGIGPVIENGFYYDFDLDEPLTSDDFAALESKMHDIIAQNVPFSGREVTLDEAHAAMTNQPYKLELIADLPDDQPITLYTSGSFTDLCRGGHVERTGQISPHFKLMSTAGAYWRGNEKNKML